LLDPLDEVDALVVFDSPVGDDGDNNAFQFGGLNDRILFSLAPGSPSLAGALPGTSPADIFLVTGPAVGAPILYADQLELGLLAPADNVTALHIIQVQNTAAQTITILLQAPPLQGLFIHGDARSDGVVDLSDPIELLGHLFLGTPESLACEKSADANDSGALEIADAIYLLGYLFLGGPAPPEPFLSCGIDPTPDSLTCDSYEPCLDPGQPN
jgi:hypothetical protein